MSNTTTDRLTEMKRLAEKEAKKLKSAASQEEIRRLDVTKLDPCSMSRCIYGLMTGGCDSARAQELIVECCDRVYSLTGSVFGGMISNAVLNGKPSLIMSNIKPRRYTYLSPIEMVIHDCAGGAEARQKLISFLKDETKTIKL